TRRIDDYEAMHALQLNGSGKIHTDVNDLKPLPEALYEIPLEDSTLYEFDGETFLLSTDRGIYKIELAIEQAPSYDRVLIHFEASTSPQFLFGKIFVSDDTHRAYLLKYNDGISDRQYFYRHA